MKENVECAKMKIHLIGQYHRIESSVSVGFPDIVLSNAGDNILIEAKVVHGRNDSYFYLEKSQKIWHLKHYTAGCSAKFVLFGPNYISIIEGHVIARANMQWLPSKMKWKVNMAQFKLVDHTFIRPIYWSKFNAKLREKAHL